MFIWSKAKFDCLFDWEFRNLNIDFNEIQKIEYPFNRGAKIPNVSFIWMSAWKAQKIKYSFHGKAKISNFGKFYQIMLFKLPNWRF